MRRGRGLRRWSFVVAAAWGAFALFGTDPGAPAGAATRPAALRVTSISPSDGSVGVPGDPIVRVRFSAAVDPASRMPTLQPATAGSWTVAGSTATFHPSVDFVPMSQVTLRVPGGAAGLRAVNGARLARAVVATFTIQSGSVLRLQQVLSLLDYSPLSWHAAVPLAATDLAAQLAALYVPPAGTFTWRQTGWPVQLTALFKAGAYNVFTRGLVMSFQADHGLIVDGTRSAGLWNDLVQVLGSGTPNTGGYNFALVNKASPETLTIFHDAKVVLRGPANTGIAADPTTDGVYPVFARYRNQVMHGRNPGGGTYADPVQYVAYFHGGSAVHYLPRPDYGIPQSLGCVELPLAEAAAAWPWLAYGTPVDVIG